MVEAVKRGNNKEVNIYFNFMLTRRRNTLLYEVRKLKSEKKIVKYFTDYDGTITVKERQDSNMLRVTSISNKKDHHLRTWTVAELRDQFK